MERIYESVTEIIGRTPLMELQNLRKHEYLNAPILAKLEFMNPGGSTKDRAALGMIRWAEAKQQLREGSVIVEPTSGNTGIGLAAVAASLGYKCVIVMPDNMSIERQKLIAAYGAKVILTPGSEGMAGAIAKAKEIAAFLPHSFIPSQFDNLSNPTAHFTSTGPEIWLDTDGKVDIFVACIGTGGTVTGTGRYLKRQKPDVQVVGVEPAASPLLSKGYSGPHGIQGIGANFVPQALNREVLDRILTVTEEEAYAAARLLGRTEGLLVGISSGAALHAAMTLARERKNRNKRIVVLLPDTGERYLSTPLFDAP